MSSGFAKRLGQTHLALGVAAPREALSMAPLAKTTQASQRIGGSTTFFTKEN
jgi:hypothetical protein